jgi:hypothetical protein
LCTTYLCARLGDSTEVVDHVRFRHPYTGIPEYKQLVLLIGDNTNVKLLLRIEDRWVRERSIANFIKSVGAVRDYFTKEDLFVGVEGVYTGSEYTKVEGTQRYLLMIKSSN